MSHLYHGSGYKQTELKPGIMHTGVLVEWDKTESNEWLYATELMEEAIAQGVASTLEKTYNLSRYRSSGNEIIMIFDGAVPTRAILDSLEVYLYKLDWAKDMWVSVNNLHNGMVNEYKTKQVVKSGFIDSCEAVDVKKWLSRKKVTIKAKTAAMNW
jgi:hypothetical protein